MLNNSKEEGFENPEEPKGGDAAIYPSQPSLYNWSAYPSKKSPYGGTLSQPQFTPPPPSKVGNKIERTLLVL